MDSFADCLALNWLVFFLAVTIPCMRLWEERITKTISFLKLAKYNSFIAFTVFLVDFQCILYWSRQIKVTKGICIAFHLRISQFFHWNRYGPGMSLQLWACDGSWLNVLPVTIIYIQGLCPCAKVCQHIQDAIWAFFWAHTHFKNHVLTFLAHIFSLQKKDRFLYSLLLITIRTSFILYLFTQWIVLIRKH
jgi:hypothetical protein